MSENTIDIKSQILCEKNREYKRKYTEKNKDSIKSKAKEYYFKNKDSIKSKALEYYNENKDKFKEYYNKNKEKIKAKNKKYCSENKDKIKTTASKYKEKNREKFKEYNEKYYSEYKEKNREKLKEYRREYYRKYREKRKIELNSSLDDNLHNCFNYFTDKEKAEKYAEYMKLQLELFHIRDKIRNGWEPDWDNHAQVKYYVDYFNSKLDKLEYAQAYSRPKRFAFKSLSQCKKFVKSVEEEKLIKYLKF